MNGSSEDELTKYTEPNYTYTDGSKEFKKALEDLGWCHARACVRACIRARACVRVWGGGGGACVSVCICVLTCLVHVSIFCSSGTGIFEGQSFSWHLLSFREHLEIDYKSDTSAAKRVIRPTRSLAPSRPSVRRVLCAPVPSVPSVRPSCLQSVRPVHPSRSLSVG